MVVASALACSVNEVDKVVDFGFVLLRNALGDPNNIPALLLLQLHKRIKYAIVELLHKRLDVQLCLASQAIANK